MENILLLIVPYLAAYAKAVAPFCGVVMGISLLPFFQSKKDEKGAAFLLWSSLLAGAFLSGPGLWFMVPLLLEFIGIPGALPRWHLAAHIGGAVLGVVGYMSWGRWVTPKVVRGLAATTRRTDLERNRKTDVREISKHLPDPEKPFDPARYLDGKKGVFLGLDEHRKPRYIPQELWRRSHIQLIGTSGAGKGVAAAVLLSQALRDGEAVVVIDPKNDEWAPHVLRAEADRLGVPFRLVDLNDSAPQLDLFDGATPDQLEELLVAGFSLAERGEAADFYRIADRQAARLAGFLLDDLGGETTPRELAAHPDLVQQKKEAAGFAGKLDELARVSALSAPGARHLSATVEQGGCLYIVGSMRNERIKSAQRMILVRLLQLVESRDRISGTPRPVCCFLDELKYHLSRPALEGLGAARDKGLHFVLAHQSLADLRDCPADLDGEAVVGAVVENCALRITYRIRDPETAEWLASMSGTIQVDDEIRRVERNLALSEVLDPERTIRQAERFLVDQNMLLNLPPRVAVVYGAGLPSFAHICPIKATKAPLELAIVRPPATIPSQGDEAAPAQQHPTRLEDFDDVDF